LATSALAEGPSFDHEVVPTLYRLGCSAGECHGSFSGKGNFRLSLFAADPEADYAEVHAAFGRRVNRQSPLLFDWGSGQQTHKLELGKPSDGFVFDLAFHADGFLMAVTSGGASGKLLFHRPGDEEPFFTTSKMANCHALSVHPGGKRLAVTATNRDSAGNGRPLKDDKYPSNWSPIHVLDLPA
jgi:hypothetical protein